MITKVPIEKRNRKVCSSTVAALESRHFEAYACDNAAEAAEKALSLIPEGSSICWGGSYSVEQTGLIEKLHQGNYKVYDRDLAKTPEEREQIMRDGHFSDFFLMSANAISEDGQLVNIDGVGNRVSALINGPKNVIVIAGANKIAKTLDDALSRARNIAAPTNCQRFGDDKTPCQISGKCGDCKTLNSICAQIVITRLCKPARRIKVILTREPLGF